VSGAADSGPGDSDSDEAGSSDGSSN
jgi:hypothetical protein